MAQGNIPGIHNYCDRWCERCDFTSRCAVYAGVKDLSPQERDIRNKAFWQRLSANFSKAKEMLEEAVHRSGVNLLALQEEMEETEQAEKELRSRSLNHPLGKISLEYSALVRQWLKTQPGMLEKLNEMSEQLTLGLHSTTGAKEKTETIKDSLEVIEWYATFIHIKLVRALMGKFSDEKEQTGNPPPSDFDGSAKVAALAVDKSLVAWKKLFDILPSEEDAFLPILSILEKVRRLIDEAFPGARHFVRPGFDEP